MSLFEECVSTHGADLSTNLLECVSDGTEAARWVDWINGETIDTSPLIWLADHMILTIVVDILLTQSLIILLILIYCNVLTNNIIYQSRSNLWCGYILPHLCWVSQLFWYRWMEKQLLTHQIWYHVFDHMIVIHNLDIAYWHISHIILLTFQLQYNYSALVFFMQVGFAMLCAGEYHISFV